MDASKKRQSTPAKRPSEVAELHPHLNLHHFVPALLTWLYNRLSNESSKLYRKWYGLGVTDWRVLAFLGTHSESTAAKMSRFIALDKGAISRSILLLKEMGLVASQQLPGREVGLQLTVSGKQRYEEILAVVLKQEQALLTGFTSSERSLLIGMLHRMLVNVDSVGRVKQDVRPKGGARSK